MGKRKREEDEDFNPENEEAVPDDDDFQPDEDENSEEPEKKKKKGRKKKKEDDDEGKKKKPTKRGKKEKKEDEKGSKKKSAKKSTTTIKDVDKVSNMILDYMKQHNRPFGVENLRAAFQNSFTKGVCQKALDALADKGSILKKESGKLKIYYMPQDSFKTLNPEELAEMEEKYKALLEEKKQLSEEVKKLTAKKMKLQSAMTTEELKKAIETRKEVIEKRKQKLATLESGVVLVSEEEKKKVDDELEKYVKIWKKRKKLAEEMISQIAEARQIKESELIEELGLETDNVVGVDIKTIGQLPKEV